MSDRRPPPATDPLQRRTVRVLLTSQVLGGVGVGSGIAVVGLLAYELSGTEALSGVSATASTLGAAGGAVLIARLAGARGRRPGLVRGYLIGALGAALAVVAAVLGSFPLHVVASVAFGWASAANLQARYAATDLAPAADRGRALSLIVWATTIGAVLGPNLTGPGAVVAGWLGLPDLGGAYVLSLVAFLAAALVQTVGLRPDPLTVARARAAVAAAVDADTAPEDLAPAAGAAPAVSGARPRPRGATRTALGSLRRHDDALTALVAIASAHATMVGVMVMTPVHMEHHGAALQLVGLTISLHIAGMYALSPLVGRLADRIGRAPTMVWGLVQLAVAVVTAALASPHEGWVFPAGLVLLGTGWSFCLVASSTLLTDATPLEERPAVQGASDLVMNLAGAAGGILAGVVLAVAGYRALAFGALLLLVWPGWRLARGRSGPAAVGVATGADPTGEPA